MVTKKDVKEQLLDVTVIVAGYELPENGHPYAITRIVRLDVDGAQVADFLCDLKNLKGVIHTDEIGLPFWIGEKYGVNADDRQ